MAAIGPLPSYVTLMLAKGRYLAPALHVFPLRLLNGMPFFLNVSLLTIRFYIGWTDGDSASLSDVGLSLPYGCSLVQSSAPIQSEML